jgi:hypothetical protein
MPKSSLAPLSASFTTHMPAQQPNQCKYLAGVRFEKLKILQKHPKTE